MISAYRISVLVSLTTLSLWSQTTSGVVSGDFASGVSDPGPRSGTAGVGGPIAGLTSAELSAFRTTLTTFSEVSSVSGTLSEGKGLGPTFNMDSCAGCHAFPAVGGSSPANNPQVLVANKAGARNNVPSFLSPTGPIREVRFVRKPDGSPDGGVHSLFTIAGRSDAGGCNLAQTDFEKQASSGNVIFRIPTPVFGAGLIEAIDDSTILANKTANSSFKSALGISGRENRNGNDGTLTKFGWKAQNKSLMIFAGEAYNVEQGVTNDLFANERDTTPGCQFNATPEDHIDVNGSGLDAAGDLIQFTLFMRFLAPPAPAPSTQSTKNGSSLFGAIGCAQCHTPSLQTSRNSVAALNNQTANLYSDLLLHHMGSGLADGISQGAASGSEFRTAPLWGLGQRLFFLHDGRTSDLVKTISAHASQGSEANTVIANYNRLSNSQKQDILNFLRSL
jgi:CxxC motif-containing protein (DUF1111 family)